MEFKLKEYHRNVSDEELLSDILRVAKLYNTDRLSQPNYEKKGKYSGSTISKRFGSWNKALDILGLNSYKQYTRRHEKCTNSEDFFVDMRNVASILQKDYISTGEYEQYGKYDGSTMFRRYKSWSNILKLAGLSQTPYRIGKGKKVSDEELFQEIENVWIKLGRQPTMTDIRNGEFSHGSSTYARHFGSWRNSLEAFIKYINVKEEANPEQEEINDALTNDETVDVKEKPTYSPISERKHKTNRDINLRMRFKIMQRDNFKCCICGRSPSTTPGLVLVIDHIHPWAKGGESTMENLQTLCMECNSGKSDLI